MYVCRYVKYVSMVICLQVPKYAGMYVWMHGCTYRDVYEHAYLYADMRITGILALYSESYRDVNGQLYCETFTGLLHIELACRVVATIN